MAKVTFNHPAPRVTSLVNYFLDLLSSLDTEYATKLAGVHRQKFDAIYQALSRVDEVRNV